MTFKEWLVELAYPARSSDTLIALFGFFVLLSLAGAAGILGLWLLIITIPAFFRYLTMIGEARARDADAAPPGAEFFSLVGNVWTFFPAVLAVLIIVGTMALQENVGLPAVIVFGVVRAVIYPATVAVLIITHSPLQSVNPVALYRLVTLSGAGYWYAPLTAVLVLLAAPLLGWLPNWFQTIAEMYFATAFFAVCGAVTRKESLIHAVDLPDVHAPDEELVLARLEKQRTSVLTHSYGFTSRDNRTGGLEHVYKWLREDPDPMEGWHWFFEKLLDWEIKEPALYFAQQYVKRLLVDGQQVAAVKIMMRCRLLNERWRPLAEDQQAAIDAARSCNNEELAVVLERR